MKEIRQEKDAKTSRESDFKEKACREKWMSGKKHAERIRDLKKKTCQGTEKAKKKMPRLQEKEIQGKGMPRETDVRKETCREDKTPQDKDMPREKETSRKR